MKREVDYDDLMEVLLDIKGINAVIEHLETSEYLKMTDEDALVFRTLRNNLEHTKDKLKGIMDNAYYSGWNK